MKGTTQPMVPRRRAAFTLIEVLVSFAVISVLVSLIVPAIGAMRRLQRQTNCLANLRSSATGVLAYVSEWKETFPYVATSHTFEDAFRVGSVSMPYVFQSAAWPTAVVASWSELSISTPQLCPYHPNAREASREHANRYGVPIGSDYWLSYALMTAPKLWDRQGADVDQATDLVATKISEVGYPSSKGMLIEVIPWHRTPGFTSFSRDSIFRKDIENDSALVAWVDGSCSSERLADLATPSDQTPKAWAPAPVLCTPMGARGRDRVAK